MSFNQICRACCISAIACMVFFGPAEAVTYTYTGPNFLAAAITDSPQPAGTYTTSNSVTGSFVVPNLLLNFSGLATPVSFSFSDGRSTLTNLNTVAASFGLQTDSSGHVLSWFLNFATAEGPHVGDQNSRIFTNGQTGGIGQDSGLLQEIISITGGITFSDDQGKTFLGTSTGLAGVWSFGADAIVTPIPTALPLFATGLGVLGLMGWRRKRKQIG